MKTISLKLPAGLHAKLERAAKRKKQTKSDIVRTALEHFLNGQPPSKSRRAMSALELAGDLVGCAEGPGDLSTNPKYMEGFGE
jgi:metal-responsive CopG/Arc/MetJ family transcriptional regulator